MAKTHPLHASQEKIKRAQSKFDYLKAGINRFVSSQPHSVRFEKHAGTSYIIARRDKDLPEDFAWEVVEAVGHLRGALDKIMVALAEKNGRGTSGVGFPFGGMDNGKPDVFPSTRMENGIKKKLTADQWSLVEAYKPYPGGNDALWGINEIANADKHRKGLVEIRARLVNNGFAIGGNGYVGRLSVGPTDCDFVLKDKEREEVLLATSQLGPNIRVNNETAESVVFGEIAPVQGKNVLVTLNQQIRLTEGIMKSFRVFF